MIILHSKAMNIVLREFLTFNHLSMEIQSFKIVSACVIWLTTLIGTILPMFITAVKWTSRLESLAGGVFLGAGLAHLLADSYEDLTEEKIHTTYPVGPATCLITFVIFTAVELFSYGEHDAEFQNHEDDHHYSYTDSKHGILGKELLQESSAHSVKPSIFGESNMGLTVPTISLYIIMDIHSTIEGLAIGILLKWSGVIAIFCAVVGHKPVEAFALALIILKCRPTKMLFWGLIIPYTICAPIGIVVGLFLEKLDNPLVLGIIASFSSGTFLFVGCHEWSELLENKSSWDLREKLWHFLFFAGGVAWMLLIAIVEVYGDD